MEILNKRTFIGRGLLAALLAGVGAVAAFTRGVDAPPEYEVKAALVYNFTQFVDWPDAAFAAPDAPFVIGVLGRDPFGRYLNQVIQGEKVGAHPIVAEHCADLAAASRCHVLFVSASERDDLPAVMAALHGRPVLTVGDFDGFLRQGGMVLLHPSGKRIRLRVDRDAARAAGLTMSAKLLRVAELTHPGRD
ncbi:MAG TPA: YfiR family protein [Opitutus sp.]|nr:YfiR family protein [Opitutus sp.]